MFETVWFRGDTDFSLTVNFDRWDRQGAKFIFGYDAYPNLIEIAQKLPETAWKELERPPKYEIQTQPRQKPDNVKQEIIIKRGFEQTKQVKEEVGSFPYRPGKCKSPYRMIVLKNICASPKAIRSSKKTSVSSSISPTIRPLKKTYSSSSSMPDATRKTRSNNSKMACLPSTLPPIPYTPTGCTWSSHLWPGLSKSGMVCSSMTQSSNSRSSRWSSNNSSIPSSRSPARSSKGQDD